MSEKVVVSGAFDDLRLKGVRFLEEAAKLGQVTVWLWSDDLIAKVQGQPPKFPESERRYLLESIRYVHEVRSAGDWTDPERLPLAPAGTRASTWVVEPEASSPAKRLFCTQSGLAYHVLNCDRLGGVPEVSTSSGASQVGRRKVIVTGCYDWLHSGHVRFFEEASEHGDLYVVLGRDDNIRLLKGEGHPLLPQNERRYMVASIRFVTQALFGTGQGWLDAEPEIQRLHPEIYAVNEDGDKGGKREFCAQRGIEYLVLRRQPAPGLPRRSSTDLRGF